MMLRTLLALLILGSALMLALTRPPFLAAESAPESAPYHFAADGVRS
jgi:hypothetical protein